MRNFTKVDFGLQLRIERLRCITCKNRKCSFKKVYDVSVYYEIIYFEGHLNKFHLVGFKFLIHIHLSFMSISYFQTNLKIFAKIEMLHSLLTLESQERISKPSPQRCYLICSQLRSLPPRYKKHVPKHFHLSGILINPNPDEIGRCEQLALPWAQSGGVASIRFYFVQPLASVNWLPR